MYKKLHSVHRHATKSDNDDRLSTKLHFFLPPTNYFSMIEAVLIFFVTLKGVKGVCLKCDFIKTVGTCLGMFQMR